MPSDGWEQRQKAAVAEALEKCWENPAEFYRRWCDMETWVEKHGMPARLKREKLWVYRKAWRRWQREAREAQRRFEARCKSKPHLYDSLMAEVRGFVNQQVTDMPADVFDQPDAAEEQSEGEGFDDGFDMALFGGDE